jgi:hypothetical protein
MSTNSLAAGEAATTEIEMGDAESDSDAGAGPHMLLDDSDEEEAPLKPKSKRQRGDARGVVHSLRAFNMDPPVPVSKSRSQQPR